MQGKGQVVFLLLNGEAAFKSEVFWETMADAK